MYSLLLNGSMVVMVFLNTMSVITHMQLSGVLTGLVRMMSKSVSDLLDVDLSRLSMYSLFVANIYKYNISTHNIYLGMYSHNESSKFSKHEVQRNLYKLGHGQTSRHNTHDSPSTTSSNTADAKKSKDGNKMNSYESIRDHISSR